MNATVIRRKDVGQRAWTRALEVTARATRDPRRTLPRALDEWAEAYGDRPALIGEAESYSFLKLSARVNQYARWALAREIPKAATVALMMRNRPEYVAIWLGLTRVGAVAALIGPDLRGAALAHALAVADVRTAIACPEGAAAMRAAGFRGEIWSYGSGERRLDEAVDLYSGMALAEGDAPEVRLEDRALRIFTSGTTGFPKAAEVSHRKAIAWTHWFSGLAGLTHDDRLYNCLPMHHSVGGVVAIGAPLVGGGSAVIAPKFSASRFWDDVARHECTTFQYIGELCRYLVAAPTHISERKAKLRLALGNGLAPAVWTAFAERFPAIRVLEFYASTEGNVWLYNVEGRVGALGRLPPYVAAKAPIALVRFDEDAQAPLRGPDGFCAPCGDGEPGEALGRIAGDAASRFEGYSDAAETEKKVLRDVFERGDAWMRTGDLMSRDADGFYRFVDRVGDTFRWKGENVAAEEVADVLLKCVGVVDALVYGVQVAGHEGRAGMAALAIDGRFDLGGLERALGALPRWARPVFLRFTDEIARTETFKPKRALYVGQGFDPSTSQDQLFVLGDTGYLPLAPDVFAKIAEGALRL
ncbi:MAG: long-chain-acyl-CoA synthetase [Pseudomonadota bacterium]|nr:long-chain-acyl-CoA synthetase [Pseudomonadota bacterium]